MEGVAARGLGVHRATSTISLSNPVKRRFMTPLEIQPTVKVIVTETSISDEPQPVFEKPRKPRKTDLSKCVKDPQVIEAAPVTSDLNLARPQQVIYLGESMGLDLSMKSTKEQESSSSIGRWSEEEGGGAGDPVYYVQCPECNKKLKQKSYRSHVRTHTGVKQFKCDLCDDRFTRRNDVMRHKRLIHEKPRDFQCEQCQKYFVSQENLLLHVEKHKTEMKCRVCEHSFGKREYYENHIKYVHPEGGHKTDTTPTTNFSENFSDENPKKEEEKKHENAPVILKKSDQPQISISAPTKMKIIYLGESTTENQFSGISPTSSLPVKEDFVLNPAPIVKDPETDFRKRDDSIQIVDDSGNIGQILKISDGNFMIVDTLNKSPSAETKNSPSEESPVRNRTLG